MIFVTVGTARQPFDRMIAAVEDALARSQVTGADVVIQYGTSRLPGAGTVHGFLPREEHERMVGEASIVISHAGVGTIIMCVRQGKRPIVIPRRADRGEQTNDHQVELADRLARQGLVFIAHDANELRAHLARSQTEFVIQSPPRNELAIERVKQFLGEMEPERGG